MCLSSLQPKPAPPTADIGEGGSMSDHNGCSCQSCGLDNLAKLFQKAMDAKTSTREAEWERSVYGKSVYSSDEIRDSDGEG